MTAILTTTQAAAVANVHPDTVRRWCQGAGLKHKMLGTQYMIASEDLNEFLDSRKTAVTPFNKKPKLSIKSIKAKAAARNRQILIEKGLWKPRRKLHCDDIVRDDELEYLEELI